MEMVSEKGEVKKRRERATPELPGAVMEAINEMCDANPYIKKTKVVAAVRAQYAAFMQERRSSALDAFIEAATADGGIKKLL
jgi:phage I-like protein